MFLGGEDEEDERRAVRDGGWRWVVDVGLRNLDLTSKESKWISLFGIKVHRSEAEVDEGGEVDGGGSITVDLAWKPNKENEKWRKEKVHIKESKRE